MNQLRAESEHYRVSMFLFSLTSQFTDQQSHVYFILVRAIRLTAICLFTYLPIYLFTYLQVFVPEDWGSYVSEMSRDAAWGDHITLQAASDAYGVGMCVISSYKVSLF